MRIYLPVLPAELDATSTVPTRATAKAYAVTPELVAELAEDDQELTEYAAFCAAAEACLDLMTAGQPQRRVVISADVAASARPAGPDAHPAEVTLTEPVTWADVAAIHIDEPAALADITAALAGDTAAADRLAERDLLWYDSSERSQII